MHLLYTIWTFWNQHGNVPGVFVSIAYFLFLTDETNQEISSSDRDAFKRCLVQTTSNKEYIPLVPCTSCRLIWVLIWSLPPFSLEKNTEPKVWMIGWNIEPNVCDLRPWTHLGIEALLFSTLDIFPTSGCLNIRDPKEIGGFPISLVTIGKLNTSYPHGNWRETTQMS